MEIFLRPKSLFFVISKKKKKKKIELLQNTLAPVLWIEVPLQMKEERDTNSCLATVMYLEPCWIFMWSISLVLTRTQCQRHIYLKDPYKKPESWKWAEMWTETPKLNHLCVIYNLCFTIQQQTWVVWPMFIKPKLFIIWQLTEKQFPDSGSMWYDVICPHNALCALNLPVWTI